MMKMFSFWKMKKNRITTKGDIMIQLLSILENLVTNGNVQNIESVVSLVEKLITLSETIAQNVKSQNTTPPAS
jgi:hypothetical protein